MLNNLKNILIGVFAALLVVAVGASAYSAFAANGSQDSTATVNSALPGNGNHGDSQGGNAGGSGVSVLDLPASELSPEEAAALLYMREEEKLARDVYNEFYALWGQPTFSNIAASEGAHMAEVKVLLDRYALPDPALEPGLFSDPELGALYEQLVAQGSVSLAEALKVGASIEEIDILDLRARLAQTDNADIQQVFNNLLAGSANHLIAFTSALQAHSGETYQPRFLSPEDYAAIAGASSRNGNAHGSTGEGNAAAGVQGGNGYRGGGNGASAAGSAGAQAATVNLAGASTLTGTVSAYDGMTMTVAGPDGSSTLVQLGNAGYAQGIGFHPSTGAGVSVSGFTDDQGQFSALTITLDGQTYTFRDELGRPLWSGGKGNGRGAAR